MISTFLNNSNLYKLLYISLIIDYILSPFVLFLKSLITIFLSISTLIINYSCHYIIKFTLHFLPYTTSILISTLYIIVNIFKFDNIYVLPLIIFFDSINILITSFVYYRYYQFISKPVIIEANFNTFKLYYVRCYLFNILSVFTHIFINLDNYGLWLLFINIFSCILWTIVFSLYKSIFMENDKNDYKKYIYNENDNTSDYELSNIDIIIITNHKCEEDCKICPCSICLDDFGNSNNIIQLKCNHIYHKDCIKKYIRSTNLNNLSKCPYCRQDISI
jgi:hypothetical protein